MARRDALLFLCFLHLEYSIQPADGATYSKIGFGLTDVPVDIPVTSDIVVLDKNIIPTLDPGDFSTITVLESLYVQQNVLTGISSTAFCGSVLKKLYLTKNQLSAFPDLSCVGGTLNHLDLSFNQITTLQPGDFSSLIKLRTLDFESNDLGGSLEPLADISGSAFNLILTGNLITGDELPVFANFSELKLFTLDDNSLIGSLPDDFCENCHSLRDLRLRDTGISDLSPLRHVADTLEGLTAPKNNIANVSLPVMSPFLKLSTLILSENPIASISDWGLWPGAENITVLELSTTDITEFPTDAFDRFHQLQKLNLLKVGVTEFPNLNSSGSTLREVNLKYAAIRRLNESQTSALTALESLFISVDGIGSWDDIEGIFALNDTLQSLWIKVDKQLSDIDPRIYSDFPHLVDLDFRLFEMPCIPEVNCGLRSRKQTRVHLCLSNRLLSIQKDWF